MWTFVTRRNRVEKKEKEMRSLKFWSILAEGHFLFCCLYWWEQSVLFSVSASPPLAVPPTVLSSWWCDKGPSEMYSSMHPKAVRESSSHLLCFGGWMREGRVMTFFFFFCFLLYLYRGFIAVLKYVRSYLHSLGLVTETNKNNILFRCFFSDVWFLLVVFFCKWGFYSTVHEPSSEYLTSDH